MYDSGVSSTLLSKETVMLIEIAPAGLFEYILYNYKFDLLIYP